MQARSNLIKFIKALVAAIAINMLLTFAIGYFVGFWFDAWSEVAPSALLLLGMSSGTLTLGLIEYLYGSRMYAMLWVVYLLLSPVLIVIAVN